MTPPTAFDDFPMLQQQDRITATAVIARRAQPDVAISWYRV